MSTILYMSTYTYISKNFIERIKTLIDYLVEWKVAPLHIWRNLSHHVHLICEWGSVTRSDISYTFNWLKSFPIKKIMNCISFFFFFLIATLFIYLFIYFWLCWVFGSCEGFLQLRQVGATLHRGAGTALHRGARAFHYRGPSRCGAQAPDAQAQ